MTDTIPANDSCEALKKAFKDAIKDAKDYPWKYSVLVIDSLTEILDSPTLPQVRVLPPSKPAFFLNGVTFESQKDAYKDCPFCWQENENLQAETCIACDADLTPPKPTNNTDWE